MNQVLVKVCGVTDVANALACIEAGADYLGLNFHPPSPRSISIEQAAKLATALGSQAELVGLFVDRPISEVASILRLIPALGTIQLHGSEDIAYLKSCRDLPTRPLIIRAFRLKTAEDVAGMTAYLELAAQHQSSPDAILVDALVDGQLGGTGHSIPFGLLGELSNHPRLILAGGLTSSNVADRVRRARWRMVDVASGVESSPGWKDPQEVAAFVRSARVASESLA